MSGSSSKTFDALKDAPLPMSWGEYEHRAMEEWRKVVDEPTAMEPALQAFMERHPSMVPGAFSTYGTGDPSHRPFPGAVITQPELAGFSRRKPEFMWIAFDSDTITPVRVEIERPQKRWFNGKGAQSAELSQAKGQLQEWREWFERPGNVDEFREYYGVNNDRARALNFRPRYVLIYGSDTEFEGNPGLNRRRLSLQQSNDETYALFTSVRPNVRSQDAVCVRMRGRQVFEVVSWPVTVRLSDDIAGDLCLWKGVEAAVAANSWISVERAQFLIDRIPKWRERAASSEFRNPWVWGHE